MIEHIPAALTSLKAAKDMLLTMRDLRDFVKISEATTEIKERLIEAIDSVLASKEQLLTFDKKISELEEENKRLKDWSLEKEKYVPKPICQGVFAHIDKDFKGNPENEYKLCSGCFEKNVKSPLQVSHPGNMTVLVCPNGCPTIHNVYFIPIK
jgi:hypothetical protein